MAAPSGRRCAGLSSKDLVGWPQSGGRLATFPVLLLPLLYLATTLIYSACMAPWGRQVDPESAYAMNGIVAAAGYGSMKFDHPGTTTTLLVEIIVRLWALVARPDDIVAFSFKNYDAIIYAARTCEAVILFGALLACGLIVAKATRSVVAAMVAQVGPFVHFDSFHIEMLLIPESLMVSCTIFGMALAIKAALDEEPPTVRLGVMSGLTFALGFSSKYLYLPLAICGVSLLRNPRAYKAAFIAGVTGFIAFNLILNPAVFRRGFAWMFTLATHKGVYGAGEPGFVDAGVFWDNMASLIAAAPLVFAIYVVAALASVAQMIRMRSLSDPVSLTLLAVFLAFALQLVATSKHFAYHYMMATWVLVGGILVLTAFQIRRLVPALSPAVIAIVSAVMCVTLIGQTLYEIRRQAVEWMALDDIGARLSRAVTSAAPACANVSAEFVRAPEDEMNHGWHMTLAGWGTQEQKDRFSESYARAFKAPLLDQVTGMNVLTRNFRPTTYTQLAAEYPCIVVRTHVALTPENSLDLFRFNPDHCVIEGIHVTTVGIACRKISAAYDDARSAASK
jgi:hypothetical protein